MSLLAAQDLTVSGPAGERLLGDLSLSIGAEETVLLAGGSGSGKSLLGLALGGLLDNRPSLSTAGTVSRSGSVGLLFQDPRTQIVRERVRSDVAFGLENRGVPPAEIHERIDAWARRLAATHLLDRPVKALSRGERTLVALLGVLVTEPDVIVLDEPLAALDATNRSVVLDTIDELRGDHTLLVTEQHVSPLLTRIDRVLVLEDGEIAGAGTPREVLPILERTGVRLPFGTRVALERGAPLEDVPLTG
mgnify:CR=1 FL=1